VRYVVGTSDGLGTAPAAGASDATATGAAAGVATASSDSTADAWAVGTAEGWADVVAFLRAVSQGLGSSHGACAAQGVTDAESESTDQTYQARWSVLARSADVGEVRRMAATYTVYARSADVSVNEIMMEEI
jgi:hypothetical protein